ncbi:hypothetical protein [Xylanimonas ulmi]|uniref:Uncharacterized protein n=1 Tax=Xylanimonas ulmi TaxID=228973 RepID=A0A4V2EYA0_9MICO|nr:hypothetical protein [Xylanibacterium ulmi]RZS62260.1 hypothetical protein EV386_2586 [Xylanibacterium ulmi]
MTTKPVPRAPEPFPDESARALLELAVGAQQVHQEAEIHLAQVVKAAVKAGATWEHVAHWLGAMTADQARERFENADCAVCLDDQAVIALSGVAQRHGLTTLGEAATLVLHWAVENLDRTTAHDGGETTPASAVEAAADDDGEETDDH